MNNADVGVVVGRFQVPDLHTGHNKILDEVTKNHRKVLIFIGVSPVKNTRKNPLDYITRVKMFKKSYPDVVVCQISDNPSDEEWSKELDSRIREICPIESIVLYGSRDGFIPRYHGCFDTIELQPSKSPSGSDIRALASKEVIDSREFRAGVIYASYNKYPISYTTVDAAIVNTKINLILLAKKKNEKFYRFIGGFVDINKDESLEQAVKREVSEETNALGIGEPIYIGSSKILDWRYSAEVDGIMTSFFYIPYIFGAPKACDDIIDLKWFSIDNIIKNYYNIIVKEHHVLVNLLQKYLNNNKGKI